MNDSVRLQAIARLWMRGLLLAFLVGSLLSSLQAQTNSKSFFDTGTGKFFSGDLTGAMADLNKAIELNPNFAEAYCGRGIVRYSKDKKDRAGRSLT
jgi:Flp pilus assembly protein TadD